MQGNRVVIDVNIFFSYFLKDKFNELFDIAINKNIRIYRNSEMRGELERVLKYDYFQQNSTRPIKDYLDFFDSITIPFETIKDFSGCADENDNYLFDLAYQTNADLLVSGDKKVLATAVRKSLRVIDFATFKREIKGM